MCWQINLWGLNGKQQDNDRHDKKKCIHAEKNADFGWNVSESILGEFLAASSVERQMRLCTLKAVAIISINIPAFVKSYSYF